MIKQLLAEFSEHWLSLDKNLNANAETLNKLLAACDDALVEEFWNVDRITEICPN